MAHVVLPPQLHTLAALAHLLERLDRQPRAASAAQYRDVVRNVQRHLEAVDGDAMLGAVLDAFPSTREVYENLRYAHAGLCRSDLEAALNAEVAAAAAIQRARVGG